MGSWFTRPENGDGEHHGLPTRPERVLFIIQPFGRLTLAKVIPLGLDSLSSIRYQMPIPYMVRGTPLVHRDLEIANIHVISYSERVKLSDSPARKRHRQEG